MAQAIGEVLKNRLGWKSAVFLPEDCAQVAFHGPRFDHVFGNPDSGEAVKQMLEQQLGMRMAESFWQRQDRFSMGACVDALLAASPEK